MDSIDSRRILTLKSLPSAEGPVIHWMIRDQRADDNWALLYAQKLALKKCHPLMVVFTLPSTPPEATLRQCSFMLEGLREVEAKLRRKDIPLIVLNGPPAERLLRYIKKNKVSAIVSDFSPLRVHRGWQTEVAEHAEASFFAVDTHNIVPCRFVSQKQEYGAYTLRPKMRRLLPEFLTDFPPLRKHRYPLEAVLPPVNWVKVYKTLRVDRAVKPVSTFEPGGAAGRKVLRRFLTRGLTRYHDDRNNPALDAQSQLSPYLHFGQLAPQRVAWETQRYDSELTSQEAFLEELIVRRELSDNFCLCNDAYDSPDCFPPWARATLAAHRRDPRAYVYTDIQLECGETHDPLWNAAQREMVTRGKMHGYLRMYWAKKILEWTRSPEDAHRIALHLNDKYSLDGCDPNGYAGVAWSIGGVHDRPWFEREIFGKIRFMSYDGCKRKFDVAAYIAKGGRKRQP